jgi:hypothetical protein
MQYGGLRSLVTCMTTYCSNDSFASPRIEPINRCIKACGMLLLSGTSASRSSCSVCDRGEHVYWVNPINVQLVTDPVIMPAKEKQSCHYYKHEPCDIFHFHVEKKWSEFRCCRRGRTIASRMCILRHSMFFEQYWTECDHHEKFQPCPS